MPQNYQTIYSIMKGKKILFQHFPNHSVKLERFLFIFKICISISQLFRTTKYLDTTSIVLLVLWLQLVSIFDEIGEVM